METPSSMRRVTRSQTSIASQKSKKEDSQSKSRTSERSALVDITNDSPIVGLATEKTPSSSAAVKNHTVRVKNTPGSGEVLLRGQVKILLQKVEEEAEFVNKIPLAARPQFRAVLDLPVPCPFQLLAPTPANTPQVLGLSETQPIIKVAEAVKPEEVEDCSINRALVFDDSPEKLSDDVASTISSVSYQDDSSSAWSVQVNVSVHDEDNYEDEQEEEKEEEEEEEEYDDDEGEVVDDYDELCEGLSKMTLVKEAVEFGGKHTRFVYNSDDEMEGEEEVLMLKGLPVPEGKHLRFKDDDDEE